MYTIYNQRFNSNEWFVIGMLIIGGLAVWKLPKRFSVKESLVYFLYFVFVGIIFDHTVGIKPFDFYDVNDSSAYQLMDFLSYVSFGPFGYLFIYLYDCFKIKNSYNTIYIFCWTMSALVTEYIADILGVYHYKNGYEFYYSFPIYLMILTSDLLLYKVLSSKKADADLKSNFHGH